MTAHPFLCIGPNSALDLVFRTDECGRVVSKRVFAGGKAANAAAALVHLGERARLVGFAGGEAGRRFVRLARERGFSLTAVRSSGETRSTYAFLDRRGGRPRLFVEPGQPLEGSEVRAFEERVASLARGAEVAVYAGSIQPGFPAARLRALLRRVASRVPLVVDAHGVALRAALAAGPALLAPNEEEWRRALGLPPRGAIADLVRESRRILAPTTRGVVVSRGPRGLLYVERGAVWRARLAPREGNPIGSGDVVTAVAARALLRDEPPDVWLALAAAAAALNLDHDEPACFERGRALRLAGRVEVTRRRS